MITGQRQTIPAPGTADSVYAFQLLTPGNVLKKAATRNATLGGGLVRLALVGRSSIDTTAPATAASITSDHIPLVCYRQRSRPEYVEWDGSITISDDFPVLVAQFYDVTSGDLLALSHGVER